MSGAPSPRAAPEEDEPEDDDDDDVDDDDDDDDDWESLEEAVERRRGVNLLKGRSSFGGFSGGSIWKGRRRKRTLEMGCGWWWGRVSGGAGQISTGEVRF